MSAAMEFVLSATLTSLMISAIMICHQLRQIARALERGAPRSWETP
jgi:hypothetical protein